MLQRSLRFAILAVLISLAGAALRPLAQTLPLRKRIAPPIAFHSDPESLIAVGGRLPLACADMFALELLPGVSDTLATEILRTGPEIIERARRGLPGDVALQIAKGVGVQKSQTLLRFISPEDSCTTSSPESQLTDTARAADM